MESHGAGCPCMHRCSSWHFLCPKSKNGHNLKPPGIIFEDPLCPMVLGIIGHNLKIKGILRKFHNAPQFLGIRRHNFNSLYNFHVNYQFLTEKSMIFFLSSDFFVCGEAQTLE